MVNSPETISGLQRLAQLVAAPPRDSSNFIDRVLVVLGDSLQAAVAFLARAEGDCLRVERSTGAMRAFLPGELLPLDAAGIYGQEIGGARLLIVDDMRGEPVLARVAAVHGIRSLWAITLSRWDGRLYGAAGVVFPQKQMIDNDHSTLLALAGRFIMQEVEASALRESEERYRTLVDTSPDAVLLMGIDGTLITVNERAFELFGAGAESIVGRPFFDFVAPEDRVRAMENVERMVNSGQGRRNVEYTLLRHDGSRLAAEVSAAVVEDRDLVPSMLTVVVRDVSLRRAAEEAVRESESGFRLLFARSPLPMWVTNTDTGEFLQVNDAAIDHYGYSRWDFGTMRVSDISVLPEPAPSLLEPYRGRHRRRDGSVIDVDMVSHALHLSGNSVLLTLAQDVTDRVQEAALLEHRALHDALTDLPNRALLEDRLHQELVRAQRNRSQLSVLLIDLDGFKEVNDTHGHDAGDDVLRQVGPRIIGALRESDTVARLGGDEFVVLLPDSDRTGASAVAGKITQALAGEFRIEHGTVRVSASIGVAIYPEDGTEPAGLLRHADQGMYADKRLQRDSSLLSP